MTEKIDFKNIGNVTNRVTRTTKVKIPVGIKTPLRRGDLGLFDMHFDVVNQIKDNFKNLLLTNHGERVIQTSFGANIRGLLFEHSRTGDSTLLNQLAQNIKETTDIYMPFIALTNLEVSTSSDNSDIPENYARVIIEFELPGVAGGKDIPALDLLIGL